jgi:hypothetical protein
LRRVIFYNLYLDHLVLFGNKKRETLQYDVILAVAFPRYFVSSADFGLNKLIFQRQLGINTIIVLIDVLRQPHCSPLVCNFLLFFLSNLAHLPAMISFIAGRPMRDGALSHVTPRAFI